MLDCCYVDQYRLLHAAHSYGNTSIKASPFIIPHVVQLMPKTVIDYGCGQSRLAELIEAAGVPTVYRYDPAIPAFAKRPTTTFDLLLSVDVLEHVPESELDNVLGDMASLARHAMFVVDTRPAKQILPNGENAHCTIRPPEWWRERIGKHFAHLEPFLSKPRHRARFKTWATPIASRPSVWARRTVLRTQRRIAKITGRPLV